MPRWLGEVLSAIRVHARAGSVRFTYKALLEMAELEPAPSPDDVVQILAGLGPDAFRKRTRSECVLVSFHQEESRHGHEETED